LGLCSSSPPARSNVAGSPSISVVIPALDEEALLPATLRCVREAAEVLVVDGGSRDRTASVAEAEGARVLRCAPGRGRQLDLGARAARGDWLVFLHADTRLEPGWAAALAALGPDVAGGAFRLAIDSPRAGYRIVEAMVRARVRWLSLPYGDQAIFARREAYARAGGFPHQPLMEDVAFVRRLRATGRLAFPSVRAWTSARRWEQRGLVCATARNWLLVGLYAAGQPPERLARFYRRKA